MRCSKCGYENKNTAVICSLCKVPLTSAALRTNEEDYSYARILSIPQYKRRLHLIRNSIRVLLIVILVQLLYINFFVKPEVKIRYFDKVNQYMNRFLFGQTVPIDESKVLNYQEIVSLRGKRICQIRLSKIVKDIIASKSKTIDDIVLTVPTVCPTDENVQYKFIGELGSTFSIYCELHNQTCIYDAENDEIRFEK